MRSSCARSTTCSRAQRRRRCRFVPELLRGNGVGPQPNRPSVHAVAAAFQNMNLTCGYKELDGIPV